jgi:hypothetical protein
VRVFKKRQGDFAGRVLYVGVAREGTGTVVLVIETENLAAESGRTTLGSVDLDVSATSCFKGRHRCSFAYYWEVGTLSDGVHPVVGVGISGVPPCWSVYWNH